MVQMETRNLRKVRQGVVISNKMDKTIVIAAKFKEMHPIYGKFVQKTKKNHAHDENNEANVGVTLWLIFFLFKASTAASNFSTNSLVSIFLISAIFIIKRFYRNHV